MKDKDQQLKNPYLAGRLEWNERYGSHIVQAKNWRLIAFLLALLALIALVGMVYIGSQSKIQPYVVTIDKIGQPINATPMPKLQVDEKVVKYAVADFITNLRSVYKTDPMIQRKMIYTAYNYLSNTLPASGQIEQFYKANSPFAANYNKSVEIVSVLTLGEKQYQIDWIEKSIDPTGKTVLVANYRAIVNIVLEAPTSDADIIKNPIGIFIKDISFQKIIN